MFLLLGTLWAAPAAAVGDAAPIDLNRFHPAPGNGKILTVDLADVGPDPELLYSSEQGGRWAWGPRWGQGVQLLVVPQLVLHYANLPLVYTQGGVRVGDVVRDRVTGDLSVAISLWRRFQVALAFPVTLYQQGEDVTKSPYFNKDLTDAMGQPLRVPPQVARGGQEDLRLQLKGVLYQSYLVGLGVAGDLVLPTGNANSFLGSRWPTFNLRLLGHLTYKRLTAGLNVGWLFGSTEQILDTRTGMGLSYALGAQVLLWRRTEQQRAFAVDAPLGDPLQPAPAAPPPRLEERTKYALSLAAEFQGLSHARFNDVREAPMEADVALKGRVESFTLFVGAGAGLGGGYGASPFRVFGGLSWAWERQPPPPAPPKPPVKPPEQPPPVVQPTCEGEDCPPDPSKKPMVVPGPVKLELSERVFFEFDKDTIKPISFPLLEEVVRVLKERPDLGRIRIEGHTDSIGPDVYNLDLSRRRAHSVVVFLLERGIESSRLTYEGYGKRCPLVPNDTAENRAKNRRVDFVIEERAGVPRNPGECPPPR